MYDCQGQCITLKCESQAVPPVASQNFLRGLSRRFLEKNLLDRSLMNHLTCGSGAAEHADYTDNVAANFQTVALIRRAFRRHFFFVPHIRHRSSVVSYSHPQGSRSAGIRIPLRILEYSQRYHRLPFCLSLTGLGESAPAVFRNTRIYPASMSWGRGSGSTFKSLHSYTFRKSLV